MSDHNYYVYAYLREDLTPYYIGKGKGSRAWNRSAHSVVAPLDEGRIIILHDSLDEQSAHQIEIELIARYGRKDLGTGILRNLTDGGEGASGRVVSEESRKKWSHSLSGREFTDEWKNKLSLSAKKLWEDPSHAEMMMTRRYANGAYGMFGKNHSDDTKQKISSAKQGVKFSAEHKQKLSDAAKARWLNKKLKLESNKYE